MISVLVVDDSFLMRKLISDLLSADGGIRVVGQAANGEEALRMATDLKPDVITMDLEMPSMDGLTATRRIVDEVGPKPIVIMVSAFTQQNADITFDCLKAGAFDCILKPSGPLSLDMKRVQRELIRQVRSAANARIEALGRGGHRQERPRRAAHAGQFGLVIIGASTGGPPVLEELVGAIPEDFPAAMLIVQHMPRAFTASLAQRLDRIAQIPVREAAEGDALEPGLILVAPGDAHIAFEAVEDTPRTVYRIHLTYDDPVHGMRPSVDVAMQRAVKTFRGPMTGVLLTGMGEDGRDGMVDIRRSGGTTIVQEPSSCVVDGMVRSAIEAGCVEHVLAPEDIPARLTELARSQT